MYSVQISVVTYEYFILLITTLWNYFDLVTELMAIKISYHSMPLITKIIKAFIDPFFFDSALSALQ